MTTLTASLTAIRYYTALDPIYYTIDNRPLTDIASSLTTISGFIDVKYGFTTSASATPTLDLSVASYFLLSPTANISAITISNPASSGVNQIGIVFTQDSSPRTITWPVSVKWPSATPPTLSSGSGKKDFFRLTSVDGGTSWLANIVGQNY